MQINCPNCTFLNHHQLSYCEVCDSPLSPLKISNTISKPGDTAAAAECVSAAVSNDLISAPSPFTEAFIVHLNDVTQFKLVEKNLHAIIQVLSFLLRLVTMIIETREKKVSSNDDYDLRCLSIFSLLQVLI